MNKLGHLANSYNMRLSTPKSGISHTVPYRRISTILCRVLTRAPFLDIECDLTTPPWSMKRLARRPASTLLCIYYLPKPLDTKTWLQPSFAGRFPAKIHLMVWVAFISSKGSSHIGGRTVADPCFFFFGEVGIKKKKRLQICNEHSQNIFSCR